MATDKLTVAQALAQAHLIEASLTAWEETAPRLVDAMGGRDALARVCEMTCLGPVPRFDVPTWQDAALEYAERRSYEQGNPYAAPAGTYEPGAAVARAAVLPGDQAVTSMPRSTWHVRNR